MRRSAWRRSLSIGAMDACQGRAADSSPQGAGDAGTSSSGGVRAGAAAFGLFAGGGVTGDELGRASSGCARLMSGVAVWEWRAGPVAVSFHMGSFNDPEPIVYCPGRVPISRPEASWGDGK